MADTRFRWFFLLPLVLCAVAFFIWSALLIGVRIADHTPVPAVPTQIPVKQSAYEEAVLFSQPHSTENVALVSANDNLDGLPPDLLTHLGGIPQADRIGLRCSERIVYEEGGFFIRESNTHALHRQVTAEPYAGLMRGAVSSVSTPYRLLTARFCETETGNLLFEYSIGMIPGHHPDEAQDATTYLASIEQGASFSPGAPLAHYDVWPYPGCRRPLAMTRDGIAYYECGVVTATEVHATYHRIDLAKKTSEQIAKCLFSYSGKPKKSCTG